MLDQHEGKMKYRSKPVLICSRPSCSFGTDLELHGSTMKEAPDDDVTDQAQTYDPLNTASANNESKQT